MTKEYIIYYGSILLSAFFGWMAQKCAKDKENKYKLNIVFWCLSIIVLVILMGFRTAGVGVDDISYKTIFNQINQQGIIEYFLTTKMELGYVIVNYVIGIFTNDFQIFIFLSSLIPICLFYKALKYERKNVNYFLAIFLFGTVLLLYFFGITRLFIAASIIAYSLRYVFEKKTKKYILCVILAMFFHYSAFFMLFLVYFSTEKDNKPRSIKGIVLLLMIALPIVLYVFFNIIAPGMDNGKYSGYINDDISGFSINDLDKLPICILSMMFFKSIYKKNKNIKIYIIMFIAALIVTIYSNFINIGRIQWYLMFAICILLPSIVRELNHSKYYYLNVLLVPIIIFYGFIYSYRIVFVQKTNVCMTNYSNVLWLK